MHAKDHKIKSKSRTLYAVRVWDRTTRWFHWINVVCVLAMVVLGLAILNEKSFGVSADGKLLLKTLHSYVGYVFVLNLGWRILWAFFGSPYARWKHIFPGHGFFAQLRSYIHDLRAGNHSGHIGHNPLGRLMVSFLYLLLFTQALTGLVLAGTDLYQPPLGGVFAQWVTAADPEKMQQLTAGSKEFVDPAAYAEMRAFRKPVVTTHLYAFYLLLIAVLLHIAGVVIADIRGKNGLVSAMISGEKVFTELPAEFNDRPDTNTNQP